MKNFPLRGRLGRLLSPKMLLGILLALLVIGAYVWWPGATALVVVLSCGVYILLLRLRGKSADSAAPDSRG